MSELSYGCKVPISAPIIIDGEGYGDFEGWALSHPDNCELMTVCLLQYEPKTNKNIVGSELPKPNPFFNADPIRNAAAAALWAVAQRGDTKELLAAEWYEQHPTATRRPFTRPSDPDARL